MDTKQIGTALARLFEEEGHRIVFRNDTEQEFVFFMNGLPTFLLEGAKVLRPDRMGALEVNP